MTGDKILAPCGDRCDLCPRFIATTAGNEESLTKVAELWYRAGWRDRAVSAEEISCRGCGPDSVCRYGIRQCALVKGHANCGKCSEYPCVNLLDAFRRSAEFEEQCRARCSGDEYSRLRKAFFEKRKNLEGKK